VGSIAAGVTDEDFPDMLTVAMLEAERIMARSEADLRQRGELTSGVTTALGRLALIPDVRQTLVTGNLAGNAAVGKARSGVAARCAVLSRREN